MSASRSAWSGATDMVLSLAPEPVATVPAADVVLLDGQRGQLWGCLADYLLLELRRALHGTPGLLRVAVPLLAPTPLYPRATRRFDFALGTRDLGPVTLPA